MNPITAYFLYAIFAVGGAGVYFLLPRTEKPKTVVGAGLGIAALLGLIALIATRIAAPEDSAVLFYLFSAIAVLAAVRVITHPRPVYSAVYFVLVVLAVAALLVLQEAEFLAVALVIIYAGAILVTYVFVIMLAQQPGSPVYDRRAREPFAAVLAGFVLMGAIAGRAADLPDPPQQTATVSLTQDQGESAVTALGNTYVIGAAVMTKYVVALEISGVLLLVALVGALGMTRKKVPSETVRAAQRPLGEVGKDLEPY